MLLVENATTLMTEKIFSIQVKKSFPKSTDVSSGKLIITSFEEKETSVSAQLSAVAMDIEGGGKRKIEDHDINTEDTQSTSTQTSSSHTRPPPLKNYQKVSHLL